MTKALICIDFINEIVGDNGKLAQKGYLDFVRRHNTLERVAAIQEEFRREGSPVVHVHLGFKSDYSDHPATSPLLGGARAGGILQLGSESAAIHSAVAPQAEDWILVKKRISAFFETRLDEVLRKLEVSEVTIVGVATDLAVQSAARDAHDRDYAVIVRQEGCAAATDEDHVTALANMSKFARVI